MSSLFIENEKYRDRMSTLMKKFLSTLLGNEEHYLHVEPYSISVLRGSSTPQLKSDLVLLTKKGTQVRMNVEISGPQCEDVIEEFREIFHGR